MRTNEDDMDFMMETTEVQALAREIKRLFVEHKRRVLRNPKFSLPPRQAKMSFFANSAKLCLRLNAKPSDLIQACFDYCGNESGPFSNALAGRFAENCWQQYSQVRNTYVLRKEDGSEDPDSMPVNFFEASATTREMYEDAWSLARLQVRDEDANRHSPSILECCRDHTSHLPFWFRIFLFPDDPIIWEKFSFPGRKGLLYNTPLKDYLKQIDAAAIQKIGDKIPAPKHEWMQYDTSYDDPADRR